MELDHFNESVNPVHKRDLTDLFINQTQVQLTHSIILL